MSRTDKATLAFLVCVVIYFAVHIVIAAIM